MWHQNQNQQKLNKWQRLVATALIWPLAWELPYAVDVALKRQKDKKKKEKLKWECIKLKSFYSAKETINKWKAIFWGVGGNINKSYIYKVLKFQKISNLYTSIVKKKNHFKGEQSNQVDLFFLKHTNGVQVHERGLNITNHQGSANQNQNITSRLLEWLLLKSQEISFWTNEEEKGNFIHCWW